MSIRSLEEILADYREEVQILHRHGAKDVADAITRVCDDVRAGAEDYLVWLSEDDAILRSGHTAAWLRRRFADWMEQGNARLGGRGGRVREYRQVVIPQRVSRATLREDARRAAMESLAMENTGTGEQRRKAS